jgi:phosphoribosyl 1,2-cyclic phosphate phosphodiesterase
MSALHYTLLGTGGSHGIPSIGCNCAVCTSPDPKNTRRRCSLHLSYENTHIVIDTPPDFREQALTFGIPQIDALFLTHAHADHIMGFDDVRRFSHHHPTGLPVYSHPETRTQMHTKFEYTLQTSYAPDAVPNIRFIAQENPTQVGPLTITPLPVPHGSIATYGYRIETRHHALAYIPDCQAIPPTTLRLLENLDLMILNALRPQPHPHHLTIEQSATYLKQINARTSLITHITHNSDHHTLQKQLAPDRIIVPWDGYTGALT